VTSFALPKGSSSKSMVRIMRGARLLMRGAMRAWRGLATACSGLRQHAAVYDPLAANCDVSAEIAQNFIQFRLCEALRCQFAPNNYRQLCGNRERSGGCSGSGSFTGTQVECGAVARQAPILLVSRPPPPTRHRQQSTGHDRCEPRLAMRLGSRAQLRNTRRSRRAAFGRQRPTEDLPICSRKRDNATLFHCALK
jgi:hypothetical protein